MLLPGGVSMIAKGFTPKKGVEGFAIMKTHVSWPAARALP
jgi:hypothetical protein